MSNLINTYPVFESSQVLTSSQLNQVTAYLDQQSRLTRSKLIGMGIVCGLDLEYSNSEGSPEISISKGVAITSEGFLISVGGCTTSWVRPYTLPEGIKYAPFDNSDPPITLYEILSEKPDADSGAVLLDDDSSFLDDKFVLLFLEIYDNDLKACLGNTCDDLGIDRTFTIRKLLIGKDDLNELLEHAPNVGNLYNKKYSLPEIVMPRTLFDPEKDHSAQFSEFTAHHVNAIKPVFDTLFGNGSSDGALHQTYSVYNALLGAEYGFKNPFGTPSFASRLTEWGKYLDDAGDTGSETHGIQYFSDFMADLVLAYSEFRESAFDLMSECCPDMTRFPRHVMLGRAVVPKEKQAESVKYRHGFIQPPIYNNQKELIHKTMSLHKRLVLMVQNFTLDRISNPENLQLRITPSNEKTGPLSLRSIPHYYDAKEENSLAGGPLEQFWNFDYTRKMKAGTKPVLMAYENQSADQSTLQSPVETPLFFDLNLFPFLRIEGHLGKSQSDVLKRIDDLKRRFNLPFNTVALQLGKDGLGLDIDYSCGFEDLQEEYAIARSTFCGFIGDLASLFEYALEHEDILFGDSEKTLEDLEHVSEILKSLKKICKETTECLYDFDFAAFQQSYKTALELILKFVLIEKELLNEIDVDTDDADEELPVINGMIQRISPVLFRFADLLLYNNFLRIYYGFRRRVHYIQREKDVFSHYIQRFPGVQHESGVHKGGTFIVLFIGDEDQTVIADFSLPYLCCDTNRCVPMCDGENSDFIFEIPPFARPDYAITTIGNPVEIDVSLNDYGFWKSANVVKSDNESKNGGSIEQITEQGLLRYFPNEEFAGYDTFHYTIANPNSGAEDRGTVTVLVKDQEEETGCYSTKILNCWGIRLVQEALENRDIKTGGMSQQQMVNLLLQSLRNTGGFSQEEIRSSTLEGEERRRQLLNCIGIEINDTTTYDELERLITDYQIKNCGDGPQPEKECYSRKILVCWGIEPVKLALNNRDIDPGDMSLVQMADTLLLSLRQSGGFTINEIRFNTLELEEYRRRLLICIGIKINENTTYQQLEQLIVEYQNDNCGEQESPCSVTEVTGTVLDPSGKPLTGARVVTENKEHDTTTDLNGTFSLDLGEPGQTLVISFPGFQTQKLKVCNDSELDIVLQNVREFSGAIVNPNLIETSEVVKILERRGVNITGAENREKALMSLESSERGNSFTKEELQLLKNKTLKKVLEKEEVTFAANDNKDVLVRKLMRG